MVATHAEILLAGGDAEALRRGLLASPDVAAAHAAG
jgi:hypothetical protein